MRVSDGGQVADTHYHVCCHVFPPWEKFKVWDMNLELASTSRCKPALNGKEERRQSWSGGASGNRKGLA